MARPAADTTAPPPATATYFAKVIAPQSLTASQTGEADVYVGTSAYIKKRASVPSAATASKTVELARGLKQSAEVTLAGGAFEIAPIVPSRGKPNCYALGEYGSQFPFAITPRKNATSGSYQINAHVLLYPQRDCVGTPSSQPSEPATVTVHVKSGARKNWNQLAAITWTEFKKFWGALVALVFALVLFLIRKRLAKWFGFKSKGDE
ncbi:MAG TPA: hypothetical protein VFX38_07375 [Gammaproteobacteria bacterium]|nr:hypothetical protein [Gammaproteobacteria bacterium]